MAKPKEGKRDEYYLSEIRSLRKENKALHQRVKQLEKAQHIYEERLDPEEIEPVKHKFTTCSDCAKGKYIEFEIMGRTYGTCNICNHRERLK